jgi:DNA-binding transcriptional MerR regulator
MIDLSDVCGRAKLAHILDVSESQTRNFEKVGLIARVATLGGRPLFSIEQARALRAKREAKAEAKAAA